MKKVMRFTKSQVSVSIANLTNGKFIAFKGDVGDIGPNSDFGKTIALVNESGRQRKKQVWNDFKFNSKSNIWFRELGAFSLEDISIHFAGDFEVITEFDKSHISINEEAPNDKPANANVAPTVDGQRFNNTATSGNNQRAVEQKANSNADNAEFGNRTSNVAKNSKSGPGVREPVRGITGSFDFEQPSQPVRNPQGQVSDLGRINTGGGNGSIGNHIIRSVDEEHKNVNKQIRIINNVEAAKLIKNHQSNPRKLTEAEVAVLARYSGWGGLGDMVATGQAESFIGDELTLSEKRHLIDSAFTGYYTNGKLIEAQWNMLIRAGFHGGRVLEPSAGVGKYISHRPSELDKATHFTAIEIDQFSSEIARLLHPAATVIAEPFELATTNRIKDQKYDLVVGNVPFGEKRIIDPNSGDSLSIHNYFLKASIDNLRKGGITSVITSTYTLDAMGDELRQQLDSSTQLLSVVRTPQGCFDGTTVMTDILTFRKKTFDARDEQYDSIPFVKTAPIQLVAGGNFRFTEDGKEQISIKGLTVINVSVNECFSSGHPNVILVGKASAISSMGGKVVLGLEGNVDDVINKLNSADILNSINVQHRDQVKWFDGDNLYQKFGAPDLSNYYDLVTDRRLMPGTLHLHENKPVLVTNIVSLANGYGVSLKQLSFKGFTNRYEKSVSSENLIIDYIELRDLVVFHLETQRNEITINDDEFNHRLNVLNKTYDNFVNKYGLFFDKNVRRVLSIDSQFGLCLGLGIYDQETDTAKKARIFFERTVKVIKIPEKASSLTEASTISLIHKGKIDKEFIEGLLNKTIAKAIAAEPGIVFLNPINLEFEHYTKYLIGNIVQKIKDVEANIESNPLLIFNTKYLENVLPNRTPISKVEASMGSGWIPKEIVKAFIESLYESESAKVSAKINIYGNGVDSTGYDVEIDVTPAEGYYPAYNIVNTQTWGGESYDFNRIFIAAVKGTSISIKKDGDVDEDQTRQANQKIEALNREWTRFYKNHEEYSKQLEEIYNTVVNCYNYEVDYSQVNYEFPGMSTDFVPRPNQKSFVIGGLNGNLALNGDPTGGGKTGCEVMLAYEMKRIGMAKLPVIVVPNHMLYQMTSEAQQIYPGARICMITRQDLHKENRLAFVAKMSMNDWDFAVITYGMFKEILAPEEYMLREFQSQIEILQNRAENTSSRREKRRILKLIASRMDKYEDESIKRQQNGGILDLSHTGIDALIYDEIHTLKNLELDMVDDIAGVSSREGSAISNIEFVKMNYVREQYYNGREVGVYGLSATPISNQPQEMYTLFRQFKPSLLVHESISNFNQWIAQYGLIENCLEVKPEGKGYQFKMRLNGYKNMPELLSNFRSFTQSYSNEQLGIKLPECEEESIVVNPNIWQQYIFARLFERAKACRDKDPELIRTLDKDGNLKMYEDNLLSILNDSSLASISASALFTWLKPDGLIDKVRVAARICSQLYKDSTPNRSSQLVFLDKSVPKPNVWNAYNHLKECVVEEGLIAEEVEFIHDAKTDIQRDSMFSRIRNGLSRLLIASTSKAGVGTNVQKKLIAGHDLDLPWRPDELIQRYGRVVRSGNTNSKVFWKRYLTKGSMDVFRLETLKRKAAFIAAALSNPRSVERIYRPEEKLDFDSMVEAVSDNPIVKEKAGIDGQIKKLEFARDDYFDMKNRLTWSLTKSDSRLETAKRQVRYYESLLSVRDAHLNLTTNKPVEIPNEATKDLAAFYTAYENARRARCLIEGPILKHDEKGRVVEVQAGDTSYLSLSALSASLSHALASLNGEEKVKAKIVGFEVRFQFVKSKVNEYGHTTYAQVFHPDHDQAPLMTVSHDGTNPGFIATKLIGKLGNELNEELSTSQESIKYLTAHIEGISKKLSEIPERFDDSELSVLYKRREEISKEVMKALNDQFSSNGNALPSIDAVKAAYFESGRDLKFNPFTCRVEPDLDLNAKYTPLTEHESSDHCEEQLAELCNS